MIRRIGSTARFALVSACLTSLTACPSAAPEGDPDGSGGESASTGTATPASSSSGGTPTSSGGSPTSSASTASGQGGDGGTSSSSQSSAGGDEGGGPPGTGGDGGGTGGDGGAASSNGGGGAGGDPSSSSSGGEGGDTSGSGGGGGPPCGGADLTTDEDNCGVCGHGCLGGECEASACKPFQLAGAGYAGELVLDDTHVWFIDEGPTNPSVRKTAKDPDEGSPEVFDAVAYFTMSLALTDDFVVWANRSTDQITKSPRDQAAAEPLTAALDAPQNLAAFGDRIFVAAAGTSRRVAAVDVTTGVVDPFAVDDRTPSLVVADDTYVYYSDGSEAAGNGYCDIVRVLHDGTERTVIAEGSESSSADNIRTPTDLKLHEGFLYFATPRGVHRLSAAGGAVDTIIEGNVQRASVDASGVYWFTTGDNTLHHADLAGNPLGTLTSARVNHIALDDDAVYWTENNDPGDENPGSRLMKLAK